MSVKMVTTKDLDRAFELLLTDGAFLLPPGEVRDLVLRYKQAMKDVDHQPVCASGTLGGVIVSALISGHIFGRADAKKENE